jgi:hypothetical protein
VGCEGCHRASAATRDNTSTAHPSTALSCCVDKAWGSLTPLSSGGTPRKFDVPLEDGGLRKPQAFTTQHTDAAAAAAAAAATTTTNANGQTIPHVTALE